MSRVTRPASLTSYAAFEARASARLLFWGVNFRESPECELRLNRVLRRLMSNCGKRGRSRNSMLALNLRPKVVPHGPRLLLGLIVRISGRLVAGRPRSGPEPPGSSGLAHGPGGHHPGDPGPVAALQKREGL